jgi:hypothetical protein
MRELLLSISRLLDGIPAALRALALFLAGLLLLGLVLWLAIALVGTQGKLSLIASGLLLIGLAVALLSGLIAALRGSLPVFWSAVAVLLLVVALGLPWGAWWAHLSAPPVSSDHGPTPYTLAPSHQPRIVQVLTDRTRSATGLSIFDGWLIGMLLINLAGGVQVARGRRRAMSLVRANGLAVLLVATMGLLLSHAQL